MAELNNRSSPFSPFSVNSVTEVLLPPYMGGESSGMFRGVPMRDLFSMEQQTPLKIDRHDREAIHGLESFPLDRDIRDVLRELGTS